MPKKLHGPVALNSFPYVGKVDTDLHKGNMRDY